MGRPSDKAIGFILFEKRTGTVNSTFSGEWFRRVQLHFVDRNGRPLNNGTFVNFAGGHLKLQDGKSFPYACRELVKLSASSAS